MADYTVFQAGGVAEYRLMRPESRNSLTYDMYQALENLCRDPGDARVNARSAQDVRMSPKFAKLAKVAHSEIHRF